MVGFVDHPFVDFVHYAQHVPFLTKASDVLQFFSSKHFPQRIVGRVDNDGFGVLIEFGRQFLFQQNPIRGMAGTFLVFLEWKPIINW